MVKWFMLKSDFVISYYLIKERDFPGIPNYRAKPSHFSLLVLVAGVGDLPDLLEQLGGSGGIFAMDDAADHVGNPGCCRMFGAQVLNYRPKLDGDNGLNTSIPGTGLYNRQKISSQTRSSSTDTNAVAVGIAIAVIVIAFVIFLVMTP